MSDVDARSILSDGTGIRCRSWLIMDPEPFPIDENLRRLTERNLELHINNYSYRDPVSNVPFHDVTPFISLSAGCVERDVTLKTNVTHTALRTALDFATTDYTQPGRPRCPGWVFYCYVLVSANRAVAIPGVAEEYRELNHNRAFSQWYWQGEVAAKINVPSAQILCAVHWTPTAGGDLMADDTLVNLAFTHPAAVINERNML
ncbi:hypothetical protein ACFYPG_21055 [Micromonospora sp. NPDC005553]|uniref:hypothetical protein n=1 Tax=Micromonospora sp. NPDC005553 TaxID=3364232 RepID=UPI003696ADFC